MTSSLDLWNVTCTLDPAPDERKLKSDAAGKDLSIKGNLL